MRTALHVCFIKNISIFFQELLNHVSLHQLFFFSLNKVCQGIELQRYPDGITVLDAIDKCGKSGIENDPLVLTKLTELHGREFWTGLGIFTQLTPWLEIMGR